MNAALRKPRIRRRETQRFSPVADRDTPARPLVLETETEILARLASRPPVAPCFRCGAREGCRHR